MGSRRWALSLGACGVATLFAITGLMAAPGHPPAESSHKTQNRLIATVGDKGINAGPMVRNPYNKSSDARKAGNDARGHNLSMARVWNEELLFAIRRDFARPTVHSRNLYHISAAMWDAWAAYESVADQTFHHDRVESPADLAAERDESIAFAAYRIMQHRFASSPGAIVTMSEIDATMDSLGYDKANTDTAGNTPAALGNRIAATIIAFGMTDGSNEQGGYENIYYEPVNDPLVLLLPGAQGLTDFNRWQPLAFDLFIDQAGNPIPFNIPDFLSAEWGIVTPFALRDKDKVVYERDGNNWTFYHDPGLPPHHGGEGDDYYKWGTEMVSVWSSHLDATDGVMIDISPGSIGNSPLPENEDWASYYNWLDGGDSGQGWDTNPATGKPYAENIVPRGDYGRILAEFWADGPASETPPGHWFTILNYVSDHPATVKQIEGAGPVVDDLEWDVKAYLTMGGMMHDVAIAAWGCKGYYDYIRPISALRGMCELGQCTDPLLPSFNVDGVHLNEGFIELVSAETTAVGQRHEHLAGEEGKIAVLAWKGHDLIDNPDTDVAGVGWILAENWWPYQRPTFVTPPFAGYVSGHSTFSRAAAEMMTIFTGSEFFPGGMGEFYCPQNEFLVFEDGPSMDVTLQWATYRDASDQTSLSRIWGGIHPPADDLPGRRIGAVIGPDAYYHSRRYWGGQISCPADMNADGALSASDINSFVNAWMTTDTPIADLTTQGAGTGDPGFGVPDGLVTGADLNFYVMLWVAGCP